MPVTGVKCSRVVLVVCSPLVLGRPETFHNNRLCHLRRLISPLRDCWPAVAPSTPCMLRSPAAMLICASAIRPVQCCPALRAPPTYRVAGVLLCLGGRPTETGLHHVCLVSPEGDHRLEHVSTSALRTPVPLDGLTGPALATVQALLESPPVCKNAPRHRHHTPRRPVPPFPPLRVPRLCAGSHLHFPPFPLTLPPDVYRAPPLSVVLASTPASDPVLPVRGVRSGRESRKLV